MIDTFDLNKNALEHEYDNHHWNEQSGLNVDLLRFECSKIEEQYSQFPKVFQKSKMIEYILDNAQIEVNPVSLFADKINHGNIMRRYFERNIKFVKSTVLGDVMSKYADLQETCSFEGNVDFGHTCPDWTYILSNGFPGIIKNLEGHLNEGDNSEGKKLFYQMSLNVYRAIIRWIKRLANEAYIKKDESPYMPLVANCLERLTEHKPETFYEALSLYFIYYEMQQNLDCSFVRSLGSLDSLLINYYENDLSQGRITENDARIMLKHFLYKFRAKNITANMPFTLCGSDKSGNDLTNTLTFLILDEYIKLNIHDPKIHICLHENINKAILDIVIKSIIDGKNSFVFMNDRIVRSALQKNGIKPIDTYMYSVVGCYEPCAYRTEIPCTTNGNINIPKAVELAITNGVDLITGKQLIPPIDYPLDTFDSFFQRVENILSFFCDCCINVINSLEKNYMLINPTPIFSGAHELSADNGIDIYAGGVKYNNSSINALGIATAVDALVAVKHVVFEEKIISLKSLSIILMKNWEGNELLRLKCKSLYPKYGNNLEEPDSIMLMLCSAIANFVDGKKNARGGVYRLGMFSIDTRFVFGKQTGASCDGRFSGETLSKNMSSVLGCDFRGVTALINSVTKIDYSRIPNGTVLDLVLHKSAVSGKDGFIALRGLVLAYVKKGGMAIHVNVLNPDELRKAQEKPEEYKTLQVRLCGWNVYFVNLSRKEQDEFITQLEATPC